MIISYLHINYIAGKAKPLKKPKSETRELDEDDIAFQNKQREEAKALKAMQDKAKAGGIYYKIYYKFILYRCIDKRWY